MICPICGLAVEPTAKGRRGSEHLKCDSCATQLLMPAALGAAYPDEYYGSVVGKFSGLAGRARRFWHDGRARRLAAMFDSANSLSVYDIGCGDGEFLAACSRWGFEVYGCEPMERPRNQAIQRLGCGIDVQPFSHEPLRRYNVITAWQVVEHIADPSALLKTAMEHLAPHGVLAISTVNSDSWQAKIFGAFWLHLDPPRHLWVSSRSAVTALVERSGATVFASHSNHLEFGPIGYIDSVINLFDSRRDRLLHCLKHGFPGVANKGLWLIAAALTPIAVALSATESALGKSATFELFAKRSPSERD